jgi:hypothetical protein
VPPGRRPSMQEIVEQLIGFVFDLLNGFLPDRWRRR